VIVGASVDVSAFLARYLYTRASIATSGSSDSSDSSNVLYYLSVYLGIGFGCIVVLLIRQMVIGFLGLRASRRLHEDLIKSVVRAPVRFFEVNPLGRVLNRFSKDLQSIDQEVPSSHHQTD
jgi:ABC-type multidrug transport system fused ATPase/permease subunit